MKQTLLNSIIVVLLTLFGTIILMIALSSTIEFKEPDLDQPDDFDSISMSDDSNKEQKNSD